MHGAAPQLNRRGVSADVLEPLARRLYATLTDGCPYPLRFNIRHGYRLRDAITRKPVLASYTDEWRPARDVGVDGSETDRLANPFVLLQHLRGRCDVAIQAPSWSSLIVLDIDRKLPGGLVEGDEFEARLKANLRRDEVLAAVWRAYGCSAERQPVVLMTPGGGYHVYFPLDRAWPLAWARQWHEHHLNRRGLGLEPGVLELYPSGVPLRAPCGRGTMLLVPRNPDDPDHLQLEPVGVLQRKGGLVRDVPAYVGAFLERLGSARRPLEAWIDDEPARPAWDPKWGPFGSREKNADPVTGEDALYQHKVEVQRAGGSAPPPGSPSVPSNPSCTAPGQLESEGHLLFGRAFREKVTALSLFGISSSRERHDAALKMTWYHHVVRRAGRDETLQEVERWLRSLPHAVKPGRESRWIRTTMREVRHYLERLLRHGRGARSSGVARPGIGRLALADADAAVVRALPGEVSDEGRAILTYLGTFADESGRVPHAVDLPSRVLEDLCGQRRVVDDGGKRRATVVAVEALEELGVLAVHTNYSVGRHSRRYTVWYRFGTGELPERTAAGEIVVGRREVEEGELAAVIEQPGEPPVGRLVKLRAAVADAANAWWRRMYGRRAFTPAEFFEASARHVLPGPFRDRRVSPAVRPQPAVLVAIAPEGAKAAPAPAAEAPPPAPAATELPHARPCVCAACFGVLAGDVVASGPKLAPEPTEGQGRAFAASPRRLAPAHGRGCLCASCCEYLMAGLGVRKME